MNRRQFIRRSGLIAGGAGTILHDWAASAPRSIALIQPGQEDAVAAAPPARWALDHLRTCLTAKGSAVRTVADFQQVARDELAIVIAGASQAEAWLSSAGANLPRVPEACGLMPIRRGKRAGLLATGTDVRGLVYATLDLADRVSHAKAPANAFEVERPIVEQPANRIRSIARFFVSDVEDKKWFYDREFWRRYLTMLAANRFNRFNFTLGIGYDFPSNLRDCYFYFAYPFLLSVPGFKVRAVPLPDEERDKNLEMLRFIAKETALRGLHFQLALWTHAYRWTNSPNANYTIEGLTPEAHGPYCREALQALLGICPEISGVTFRIHGESGVPEGSYDFWKTLFEGITRCGRKVEIDMHAKGMDQQMIDIALATGMPVNVSPKFWAEHMGLPYMQAAIRELEMPPRDANDKGFFAKSSGSRKFLRYGYGDLLAENRKHGVLHRIWPGTQRFLSWGDPVFASGYGRAFSFCGSAGFELCEPLSFKGRKGSGLAGDRNAYADAALRPAYDFEKHLYSYRLWGRLSYNPGADPETWRRDLRADFGPAASEIERALGQASRILPLLTTAHLPSAANNSFWPEIYTNMPIVNSKRPHPYGDTPSPRVFANVSPLDPELFSTIEEFVSELVQDRPSGKYSPAEVARWEELLASGAMKQLRVARKAGRGNAAFQRLAADVAIEAGLAQFFASKIKAASLNALFDKTGSRSALEQAVAFYRAGRSAWAELAERARTVYLPDITFGYDKHLRGHWLDRLKEIDADVADLEKKLETANTARGEFSERKIKELIDRIVQPPTRPRLALTHRPPASFAPGEAISIAVAEQTRSKVRTIRLRYRRVNQAERWQELPIERTRDGFRGEIPGSYTRSPFPVQYYFKVSDSSERIWLEPGFDENLANPPYHLVRQKQATS